LLAKTYNDVFEFINFYVQNTAGPFFPRHGMAQCHQPIHWLMLLPYELAKKLKYGAQKNST